MSIRSTTTHHDDSQDPVILTVPGLGNSGPSHWQTAWERKLDNCERAELGLWDAPHLTLWVNKLNLAIHRAARPVILVAHSLGCLAVAWWAKYERPAYGDPVVGALLVAPPEVDVGPLDPRLLPFAPAPIIHLPFPSILVASRNDPYISLDRAHRLARFWGSDFVDAGDKGHINADSGLGDWREGMGFLKRLLPLKPLQAAREEAVWPRLPLAGESLPAAGGRIETA